MMGEVLPNNVERGDAVASSMNNPRPFLKWAGSKHSLLSHITPLVPKEYNKYFEPFIGAGSLFLHLSPDVAQISDLSSELIAVWRSLQIDPEGIVSRLEGLRPDRELFYEIRGNRSSEMVDRAAELIYLNKSCWNGLYRVNSKGEFNVPFGSSTRTEIIDPHNIMACAKALGKPGVDIVECDFEKATESAEAGDFAFFDPPYVTKHNFNGFRDYNEKLFSWSDQERLAQEARRLRDKGVAVLVANAAHADIKALYSDFSIYEFERSSTLASRSNHRGRVSEVIFYA